MTANLNMPIQYSDSPYFLFKTFPCGSDPETEDLVFALRYQIYCLERGFLPTEDYPDGLEQDEYDKFSTYVIAVNHSGVIVGSLRIIRVPDAMPFPFQQHCKGLFEGNPLPHPGECVEVSRVIVNKSYRRRAEDNELGFSPRLLESSTETPSQNEEKRHTVQPEILMGILRQAYAHCKKSGVTHWYVAVEPALARLLKKINFAFEAIGEEEDYYGPVTPYILAIAQFESDLEANAPAVFQWFQEALHQQAADK